MLHICFPFRYMILSRIIYVIISFALALSYLEVYSSILSVGPGLCNEGFQSVLKHWELSTLAQYGVFNFEGFMPFLQNRNAEEWRSERYYERYYE